jgi:mannosylglycerate hydrolase
VPTRNVAVVPHTHWDREWYESFETFRLKLVDTLDALVDLLESDPSYGWFLLDGQMAAVDDYLEIRPEATNRIRELASSGRLSVGPWYVLMDEFLVSGETIVRNLELGMDRAASFGGAMDVGYLPDMFGHIAQMPQILAEAGFAHAVVWRGVPSQVDRSGFWWEAPDGSKVRAEYLTTGYSNAATLPDDAAALVQRTAAYEKDQSSLLLDGILYMNGSDHLAPQPHLGRLVAEANALQDDYDFHVTSLPRYLEHAPTEGLATWRGELRSGFRANLLMGVTSNRVDVKRAAALAEVNLERRAEPYAALFGAPEDWPGRLLELAWLGVVRNAAHDSICACSVDAVVDSVLERFAESHRVAVGLAERGLGALARSMAKPGSVVVNPAARTRSGIVELVVIGEPTDGASEQVLSSRASLPGTLTLDAASVTSILGMLQGTRIADDAWVHDVRIEEDETGVDITVAVGTEELPGIPVEAVKENLAARLAARPDAVVRVALDQPPIRQVVARVTDVPGLGWAAYAPAPLTHPVSARSLGGAEDPLGPQGSVVLTNGLVTVVVSAADGTFSIDGHGGLGRLVDGGDLGDSYNYSPPKQDRLVDMPDSVRVEVAEAGPVRAGALVTSEYRWPEDADPASGSRRGEQSVSVTTKIELHADETAVVVTTSFVNPVRDHRLRVHFPLPAPVATSVSGSAFGSVERGLTAEGRADEFGLPTFPARDFVAAGGLTVCHAGVHEHELIDLEAGGDRQRAMTLAMTLLRSTGMLSRVGMAYRPVPAGPLTPVEGLQLVGHRIVTTYALAIGDVDPWSMAEDLVTPLESTNSLGGGWRAERGSGLTVAGARLSALRRHEGHLEVRVFNPTAEVTTVDLGNASGWLVDLRGRPTEPFDRTFALRPFGIATARLTERPEG